MKKLYFLLPVAALFIQACSNDFEVAAPWKEIPAVYGILSPKDTAHYIRVEKAFLDPETNALEIAQIADSLYYPENAIDVYLERVSTGARSHLQRVDGNLEGYVRKDGVFATTPNWLYKTKDPILEGESYRFILVRADGKADVTAETSIPKEFKLIDPDPTAIPPAIVFIRDKSSTVRWRTDGNGVFFAVHFRIRYREETPGGSLLKHDTLYWTPIHNVRRTDIAVSGDLYKGEADISTTSFYNFLVQNIPPANDRYRYFDGIDITLEGGGKEIERYLETASANSGLTSAEVVPTYTNLSEGYGIFTAKNQIILNKVRVKEESINSMNDQSPTRELNFRY